MNLFERYILASVMTNRYIHEDATYKEWIEDYQLHLKRIGEEITKSTEYNDDIYEDWMFFKNGTKIAIMNVPKRKNKAL